MALSVFDPLQYAGQLADKITRFKAAFAEAGLALPEPEVFPSPPLHYRLRAEFRIWHHAGRLDYAMFDPAAPKTPVFIDVFPAAALAICERMPRLRERLHSEPVLARKLFRADFHTTLSGDTLLSLLYHRPLDDAWDVAARALAADLGVQLLGRSRGQKRVIGRDWVLEEFEVDGRLLRYQQIEGSFSQPNGEVNRQMLAWARARVASLGGDLLELYCGNGNFTIALAPLFDRVLATEVSKASVRAAHWNLDANQVDNVALVRMSSDEISDALGGGRSYRRLQGIELGDYRFSTLFVDPPRSGLDAATRSLASGFAHVLYVSCNPHSLIADLAALRQTHRIRAAAVFDQFPYTAHLECGVLLGRH